MEDIQKPKHEIKTIVNEMHSRFAEENVIELEDIAMETIQNKPQKKTDKTKQKPKTEHARTVRQLHVV